jgi:predicted HTH transcriptional regulator
MEISGSGCYIQRIITFRTVIHSDGSQEIITSAFFRTGDIKSWGRGIEKVRNACIEYGTDFPTFQFMPDGLLVMFKGRIPAEDSTQKISENAGEYYPRTIQELSKKLSSVS